MPLVPAEPLQYDLAVETPDGLKRVQVKSTSHFDRRSGCWSVSVCRKTANKTKSQAYSPDEVDLFMIVDGDLELYLIPFEVIGGRLTLSLKAYEAYKVGSAKGLGLL